MLEQLKNHPFAVNAFFKRSTVLTFAFPRTVLEPFLPPCLSLDTFKDKWGFVAVAMVQTEGLRPKGFPKFMGNSFFLIGYRIFVRYQNQAGKRLRGLYILQSETDKRRMQWLGNIFTHYHYHYHSFIHKRNADWWCVARLSDNFRVTVDYGIEQVDIPIGSPFSNWKEARRFAGPLPFTFTYKEVEQEVVIVKGIRQNWKPQPVQIESYQLPFFEQKKLEGGVLASAFEVRDIPYAWQKGIIEAWNR